LTMLYKGVKYACGTCIKGHRSSQCTHAERPLFEIRKKGRPATQCSLCRDLRKTKQVHIKCACTHKSATKGKIKHGTRLIL
ncbi:copper fist DNA binding domain-domain-containing protein, partial [Absidia repens]